MMRFLKKSSTKNLIAVLAESDSIKFGMNDFLRHRKVYKWLNLVYSMVKITMIKVSVETRELLKKLKIVPRESYDDVLKRLIKKNALQR